MTEITKDQIRGMFLGGAIGDALFMPLENISQEKRDLLGRVATYIRPDGHKWFNGREAGTWTDDTQLTLAVADSLIEQKAFQVWDMAKRHVESFQKEGDLGFGPTTRAAIKKLTDGAPWSQSGVSDNPKHGLATA